MKNLTDFKLIILLFIPFLLFSKTTSAQTIKVTGTENNINITKVKLAVGGVLIEQERPTGNENPSPQDEAVLIKSVVLENGKEIFVTTRNPEVVNPNPVLGSDLISDNRVEIINSNKPSVGHKDTGFLPNLAQVVSKPDLRSYWSIGSQPSIPSGERFVDLLYQFPSSGYVMFTERNGNSAVDLIALGPDGKPIPGATTVQIRGYQWNTGVNHITDVPSQKQWLVVFKASLFETFLPIHGVRVISVHEPDGKLLFFMGSLAASPDYAGPISNLTGAEAVLNVFDNDEINGNPLQPFDVKLNVVSPFPENTLKFHADGTVDVPAGTSPGTYTMTYEITDVVGGESDQALVTVRVHEQMPEANDDNGGYVTTAGADAVVNVLDNDLLNGRAAILDEIILTAITNTTNGVLTMNSDGSIDVAAKAQPGMYQLTYQICDKENPEKCDTAIVTVYYEESQLLAVDDEFGVLSPDGVIGNILKNDLINGVPVGSTNVEITIKDNAGLVELIVEENGTLQLPPGTTPGDYVLLYELAEKGNPSNKDEAEVSFTVSEGSVTAIGDQAQTNQNQPVDIPVLDNDKAENGSLDPSTVAVKSPAGNGTVTVNEDGTLTYTPASNFSGEDHFTYTVCDGPNSGACSTAMVNITVRPILIELLKTVDKTAVTVGEMLTYTITLTNNSSFELTEVNVVDMLPEKMMFVSGSPVPSGETNWSIPAIAPKETIQLSLEAMAITSGEAINKVEVLIGDYHISGEAETVTIISQSVDLSINKNSFGVEIFQGNEFEYEIKVENKGGAAARDVMIVDDLPPGLSFVSTSHTSTSSEIEAVSAVTGNRITWTVANFPAGQSLTISLKVRADQLGQKINSVEVTSREGEELTPSDNVDQDSNEVLAFFIPNVITPGDKDNKNDQLVIHGIERFDQSKLVILNRWGDHVFEAENYKNNWAADGLSAGSYFYTLVLQDSKGEEKTFQGWVQVIKK